MIRAALRSLVVGTMASSFLAHGAFMAAMPDMSAMAEPAAATGAMPCHDAGTGDGMGAHTPDASHHGTRQPCGCCACSCCQHASRVSLAVPASVSLSVAPRLVLAFASTVVPRLAPRSDRPFAHPPALGPPLQA
jgi:hypothetical protein